VVLGDDARERHLCTVCERSEAEVILGTDTSVVRGGQAPVKQEAHSRWFESNSVPLGR
jgi:hypothetical protein